MLSILISLTLAFVLLFFLSRLIMEMYIIRLIKNNRHRTNRKKGQSFWEWLTYKRFWDIIKKSEIAFLAYWGNFALYLILIAVALILNHFNVLQEYRSIITYGQLGLVSGVLGLRFASWGGNRH